MAESYVTINQRNENGRMMLESNKNGPLVYPTVEENGQIRKKKYVKLTEQDKLKDDGDVQAINIILQGLPPDVYSLVNHHQVAIYIWDKVNLLMKCTELSYQERECKLYNKFDKFASVKGESLYEYYWRFSQLINDMHTIGLAVLVFLPGDDPIACLNKAMAFMSTVVASRFPSTNNQLRMSSNLRNHATIHDGRIMQLVKQGLLSVITVMVKGIWQGSTLSQKGLGILHDLGIPDGQAIQTTIPQNAAFQTDDLDAYDFNYIFTKALGQERLDFLINKLGMRSMTPETLKSLAEEEEE
ncbi:hypothetical protein Tco_1068316 [Tanacetum coccineum]|uniref:Uncharacterized protein n=1 Tax=Tanacetum coccineum TaxID=301880 RepID=A0ABQ5HG79_9ASTR